MTNQVVVTVSGVHVPADTPTDSFWGCGADRKGQNELGKLWMKLRAELRQSERRA